MADAVPNLLARDARFGPLSTLTERIQGLDVSKLLVYLIDLVDADALPHLADQFHVLGLEGWNAALTEDSRRALIQSAIELHRHKGTPWALKRALAPLGLTVDVIDQMIQRAGLRFMRLPCPVAQSSSSQRYNLASAELLLISS